MQQIDPALFPDALPLHRDALEREVLRLREELSRERILADHTNDYVFTMDRQGNFLDVNPATVRDYGYTRDEFRHMSMADIVAAEHLAYAADLLLQRLQGVQEEELAQLLTRKRTGEPIWVEVRTHRFRDLDGNVQGVQGIARNVTDAKEGRLRALFEEAADAIIILDDEGHLLDVNQSGVRLLGYSRGRMLRLSIADLFPPDVPGVTAGFRRIVEGERLQVETELVDAGGTRIPVEIVGSRLSDGRILGAVRDISDRRQIERALLSFEERYRNLIDNATDLIYELDVSGRILFINQAGLAGTGYSFEELEGLKIFDVTHPDDVQRIRDRFVQFAAGDDPDSSVVIRLIRKDGTHLWVEARGRVIRDADGHPTVIHGIARDITAAKLAEEEAVQTRETFETFLQHLPGATYIKDADGKYLFSTHLAELYDPILAQRGAPVPASFAGKTVFDLLSATDAAAMHAADQAVLETHLPQTLELATGDQHHLITKFPIPDGESGTLVAGIIIDVSERKRVEQVLAEREAQLRTVISSLPIVLFTFDRDGIITLAEGRVLDDLKTTSAALVGRSSDDFHAMRPDLRRIFNRTLAGETVTQRWEGEERVLDLHYAPLRAPDGAIVGVVGVGLDHTDRVRDREALEESQASLARAQQVGHLGSWEIDVSNFQLTASDEAHRIFGLEPRGEPLTTEAFWSRVHSDDLVALRDCLLQGAQSGEPQYIEHRIRRPDGEQRVVAEHGEAVRDENGTITKVVGTVQDITDRRLATDGLAESEQRLRSFVRNAPVVLFATDAEGTFTMTDGKALAEIGLEPGDWVGRTIHDIPHKKLARLLKQAAGGLEATGTFELEGVFFDHHYTAVRSGDGRVVGVVGVAVNVQERRQLEEQLRQAKKMEAVGLLAGGIAHDFNNVLSVITGYSELALMSLSPSHPLHESRSEIRQAGQGAATLTRQLLAFSRRQVLEPEIVDLAKTIKDLEAMVRRLIGEDLTLHVDLPAERCLIKADPGQIEQVIMNLILNARDAMPAGGSLTLSAGPRVLDPPVASRLGLEVAGEYIFLSVTDEGHGMDVETRERIFEPFFTTKDLGKGTGLGLATVYGIVRQSSGAIDVESSPGEGATFSVFFPEAGWEEPGFDVSEAEALPKGSERILLAEDEEPVRKIVSRVLTDCGYEVLAARDGAEAIRLFEASESPIDLLFTDVVMPGMRGTELASRLREARPDLRVLFTSGYVDTHHSELEHRGPGTGYLQKPVSYPDIARKVREVLDSAAEV